GVPYDAGVQVARIDTGTGTVDYFRTNAPAPLRVGDAVKVVAARPGPLLSATATPPPTVQIQTTQITLAPHDRLYMLTDGVFSALSPRKLYAILSEHREADWPEPALGELLALHGATFEDDVTIVSLTFM